VRLLDRIEAMTCTLETTRQELESVGADLTQRLDAIDGRVQAIAQRAAIGLVERLAQHAGQALRTAVASESRVIADASQRALVDRLDPLLRRLSSLLDERRRFDRPWEIWLTHAATAIFSGLATWSVAVAWAPK